ncbi:hypothetical protein C0J52_15759, partial [Blattella germanica]
EIYIDLNFLADITSRLNKLNFVELQGKTHGISGMISAVNAFQRKLKLWISHLNKNSLSHFPTLKSNVETLKLTCSECDLPSSVS